MTPSESARCSTATVSRGTLPLRPRRKTSWACAKIYPFPIGSYYCNGQFVRYCDIADTPAYSQDELPEILTNIREKLVAGVDKRLDADTPVGFLLSGGLDSSLVCAIAAKKLGKPIRTFAIGMSEDAIDLKYAKQVADYLHADHTEVIINRDIVLDALEKVIAMLGTWILLPSARRWVCIWSASTSTSTPTSACC